MGHFVSSILKMNLLAKYWSSNLLDDLNLKLNLSKQGQILWMKMASRHIIFGII